MPEPIKTSGPLNLQGTLDEGQIALGSLRPACGQDVARAQLGPRPDRSFGREKIAAHEDGPHVHLGAQLDLPSDVHLVAVTFSFGFHLGITVALVAERTLDAAFVTLDVRGLVGCAEHGAQGIHEEFLCSGQRFTWHHTLKFHTRHPNRAPQR